ncbi:T9SS type A sorting domain-containing protein [Flavobacterium sp.]|uniref:T9SS type A sorting domain-containing protein n=1 Tax=Flavobacterium sp. TaxID=239 RepID=UPI00391CFBF6
MKKILLSVACLFSTVFYAQIGFQEHEVTSFSPSSKGNEIADIDNDGDLDIVTYGNSTVYWFENKFPEEGFMPKQHVATIPGTNMIMSIDITDFDGDGDLDILGAELFQDKLFLCINLDGQGTFAPFQVVKTVDQASFVKHIDMDNDGDKDLMFSRNGSNGFFIGYYENINQPTNYVTLRTIYQASNVSNSIKVADLDNNGFPDIFLRFDTGIGWIKNNGNASFSPIAFYSTSNNYFYHFDLGDIDNDGDLDLVGNVENNVYVKKLIYKLNDGLGNFGADQNIRQNLTEIKAIKLGDLDNDNRLDLIVAIRNNNSSEYFGDINWYKNSATLTFTNTTAVDTNVRMISQFDVFDLNNDGYKDIASFSNSHRTTTYQNSGAATFGAPKYPAAANLSASAAMAGDIDGDGDIDLVTSSLGEGKIYWYKNTNNIYSNQIMVSHDAANAKKVALADIDGDGHLDIVSISGPSTSGFVDKVSWYKNLDGLGNFGPQINIPIGIYDSPDGLVVYDVDADGDMDIVTALTNWPSAGDKIVWYANNGSGGFATEQIIGAGPNGVSSLKNADIDNDGDFDLVCTSRSDNTIAWYQNLNGQGSFGPKIVITSTALSVGDVAIADLDGDGDNDIAYVSNGSADDLLWQPNLGTGTFGATQVINSNIDSNGSNSVAAADIDSDGDIDIIVGEATKTTWSENLYGQANFEPPKVISTTVTTITATQVMDADNDGDLDILQTSSGTNKVLWFKNQGINQNTIKGVVRLDTEGNGCGANDAKLPNILVATTNGTNTYATLTFRNEYAGQYRLYVGQGEFETTVMSDIPNYFVLNPLSHDSSFTGFGNIDTADFCIEPIGVVNDLNVALYPLSEARPGFNASYQLVYKNIGTTNLTGQASLQYDNTKMQFLNASPSQSGQTANTLNFNYTNLAPFEIRTVMVNFNILPPPTTNINEELVFHATVTPNNEDNTPQDNTFILEQTVIGSYDPNDITCLEGEQVLIENANDYLHYVIRFQNTGTASAINVRVEHVLDPKLDWTTLQLEGMSHNGRTTITDGSLVTFMFNNIRLPHSAANEAASNGYIMFKIKPIANTIDLGDTVNATAAIYFDFNPPIITNTATTTYVNALANNEFEQPTWVIYPNPTSTQLQVSGVDTIVQLQVHTILGSKVVEANNTNAINVSDLAVGVYLLTITTETGNYTQKFIKQ